MNDPQPEGHMASRIERRKFFPNSRRTASRIEPPPFSRSPAGGTGRHISPDLQLLQALAVQCAARARGDHRNAPVKAKLLLRQLRQPLDLMRAAAERLNELGGAHGDPEPCADGSTHRREARADERDAPGDASLVERCNSRPAEGARLLQD